MICIIFFTLNLARMTLRDRALTAYKEKEMNLDRYIEELKSLVNVDCGTQTIAGVAAVAGILESLWQREGWHTGQVNLGEKVGPGLFVSNKPQAEQFDVLLVGHLDTVFAPGTVAERPLSEDDRDRLGEHAYCWKRYDQWVDGMPALHRHAHHRELVESVVGERDAR